MNYHFLAGFHARLTNPTALSFYLDHEENENYQQGVRAADAFRTTENPRNSTMTVGEDAVRTPHTEDTVQIDGKTYLTRRWLRNNPGPEAHRRYYGQLVTPAHKEWVRDHFRQEWPAMVEAYKEDHLTPFNRPVTNIDCWYLMDAACMNTSAPLLTKLEFATSTKLYWTMSGTPCIMKTAAAMAIAEELAQ